MYLIQTVANSYLYVAIEGISMFYLIQAAVISTLQCLKSVQNFTNDGIKDK